MRWTTEEFEILLSHPDLSDQELSDLLTNRSADAEERTSGAVAAVRGGIDQFHNGRRNAGLLSQPMLRILEERYPRVAAQ